MSPSTSASKVEAIADLIGNGNFITFEKIEQSIGMGMSEVIGLKPLLGDYMRRREGGSPYITVTSRIDLNPPGLFIDD